MRSNILLQFLQRFLPVSFLAIILHTPPFVNSCFAIMPPARAKYYYVVYSTVGHTRIIATPQKVNKLRKPCYTTTVDESLLLAFLAQRRTGL